MIKQICSILLAVSFTFSAAAAQKGVNIYDTPRDLPERKVTRSDGAQISLDSFPDDFVLAMFWSRHCVPCIKELDEVKNFALKTQENGIRVILISPSQEWKDSFEQREFLEKFGADGMEFYTDEHSNLASDLGIFTSPNTVLVNRQGKEIGRIRGAAEWDDNKVIEYIYKIKAQHG